MSTAKITNSSLFEMQLTAVALLSVIITQTSLFFKAWKTGKSHVLCDSVFHISFWGALVSFYIDFLVFHSQFFYKKKYPKLISNTLVCCVFFLPRCYDVSCLFLQIKSISDGLISFEKPFSLVWFLLLHDPKLCFLPSPLLRCFLLVSANHEHLWWADFVWKTLFSSMVSAAPWPKFCLYINSLSVYQANRNHTVNKCNFKACVWSVKQYTLMSQ